MECFFDEKRRNDDRSSKIKIDRCKKKKKKENRSGKSFEFRRSARHFTSWERSGEGGNKFPSLSSFLSSVKQIRAVRVQSAQRGTEGAKRKNEFMERSLDGRAVKERLLSGRFTSRAS